MMKKKILYSIIATTLISIVLFTYMKVAGNPYEMNNARESLKAYLEETYPDMDYKIKWSAKYVSTDESYRFEVMVKDSSLGVETTYPFDVYRYKPNEVFNDTLHKSRVDIDTSKKLNKQAEQYILTFLQKKVPELYQVDTDVEVYNNDVTVWTPKLKTPKPILIILEMEKGDLNKEQMLQQAKTIQQQLNEESIDYYLAEVGYHEIVNGEENYEYVSFTPQQKLTINDVD
ncbi:hypothetical protein M3181_18870 [Mesobacillus maritimus]|uniref:YfjL-like protein n=1 Tax=Mesobacillus maritimus TaxID=1643336 RepID=UPI00203B121E|nr:hypothetical protein [Mesobacillus maritimus]MCM3671029.1 hypothetical protein [Mesobacillus maritimus]